MSAPIFKILIDLDEYLKLLTLKEVVKKQEEELKKHYETKSTSIPHVKSLSFPKLNIPNEETKIDLKEGGGQLPENNTDQNLYSFDRAQLIRDITAEVSKTFEKNYNLHPISSATKQEGTGAEDLIQQPPIAISLEDTEFQPVEGVEIKKSRLNDDFDLKRLLDEVPVDFLNRAEKLVQALQEFPSEITWDSSGTIFIDQHSLPDSNIYELFPKLFRNFKFSNKILHLKEVATKIASLGYGSLINSRLTSGLSRKKPLSNHEEMVIKMKSYPNWWYIGE